MLLSALFAIKEQTTKTPNTFPHRAHFIRHFSSHRTLPQVHLETKLLLCSRFLYKLQAEFSLARHMSACVFQECSCNVLGSENGDGAHP